MGTVTNLAEYRARRAVAQTQAPPKPEPKEKPIRLKIAEGVVERYAEVIGPVRGLKLNAAVRLLAGTVARAIVKELRSKGEDVPGLARFQFFGVLEAGQCWLVVRVNSITRPDALLARSGTFLIDPKTSEVSAISSTDNISKNNTFTTLITLPMSEFYKL